MLTERERNILQYAQMKHDETYETYNGTTYFLGHVLQVMAFSIPHSVVVSGCHDLIEDTDADWSDLVRLGANLQELSALFILTDPPKEGFNRARRKEIMNAKLMHSFMYDDINVANTVLAVKLADRLVNFFSPDPTNSYRDRYREENKKFNSLMRWGIHKLHTRGAYNAAVAEALYALVKVIEDENQAAYDHMVKSTQLDAFQVNMDLETYNV